MKWKYNHLLDVYLCKSCNKLFEEVNKKERLYICPRCQKPICHECVKLKNKFCLKCIDDSNSINNLISICGNSGSLNEILSKSIK